jgi:hypothetical protein
MKKLKKAIAEAVDGKGIETLAKALEYVGLKKSALNLQNWGELDEDAQEYLIKALDKKKAWEMTQDVLLQNKATPTATKYQLPKKTEESRINQMKMENLQAQKEGKPLPHDVSGLQQASKVDYGIYQPPAHKGSYHGHVVEHEGGPLKYQKMSWLVDKTTGKATKDEKNPNAVRKFGGQWKNTTIPFTWDEPSGTWNREGQLPSPPYDPKTWDAYVAQHPKHGSQGSLDLKTNKQVGQEQRGQEQAQKIKASQIAPVQQAPLTDEQKKAIEQQRIKEHQETQQQVLQHQVGTAERAKAEEEQNKAKMQNWQAQTQQHQAGEQQKMSDYNARQVQLGQEKQKIEAAKRPAISGDSEIQKLEQRLAELKAAQAKK